MTGSFIDNSGAFILSTTIYGNRHPVDAAGNGFFHGLLTGGRVSPSNNTGRSRKLTVVRLVASQLG